ncbi:MAG: class I SAM-dependent methyltransferase [Flavipsychrobacter sp.]
MSVADLRKKVKLMLTSRVLAGNNVTCNICNRSFTTFIPHFSRINAKCPNCASLERTRLAWYFLDKLGLVKQDMKLLHIAPETALFNIFRKRLGKNYVAGDMFTPGYKYAKGTVFMDVTDIPYPDEYFDGVICIHVLEHVQDDAKGLSELYRVLKKGGFGIILVPNDRNRTVTYEDASITDPLERRKHFLQSDHVRIYGRDYIERFKAPGFKVEHEDFAKEIPNNIATRHVFKSDEIFLLRK